MPATVTRCLPVPEEAVILNYSANMVH